MGESDKKAPWYFFEFLDVTMSPDDPMRYHCSMARLFDTDSKPSEAEFSFEELLRLQRYFNVNTPSKLVSKKLFGDSSFPAPSFDMLCNRLRKVGDTMPDTATIIEYMAACIGPKAYRRPQLPDKYDEYDRWHIFGQLPYDPAAAGAFCQDLSAEVSARAQPYGSRKVTLGGIVFSDSDVPLGIEICIETIGAKYPYLLYLDHFGNFD